MFNVRVCKLLIFFQFLRNIWENGDKPDEKAYITLKEGQTQWKTTHKDIRCPQRNEISFQPSLLPQEKASECQVSTGMAERKTKRIFYWKKNCRKRNLLCSFIYYSIISQIHYTQCGRRRQRDACNLTEKTKSASDKQWPRNHPFHLEREEGLICMWKMAQIPRWLPTVCGRVGQRDGVAPGWLASCQETSRGPSS